jgi:hypothetical protein
LWFLKIVWVSVLLFVSVKILKVFFSAVRFQVLVRTVLGFVNVSLWVKWFGLKKGLPVAKKGTILLCKSSLCSP